MLDQLQYNNEFESDLPPIYDEPVPFHEFDHQGLSFMYDTQYNVKVAEIKSG